MISHNRLTGLESLHGVLECPSIRILDVSHNRIDDPDVLEVCKDQNAHLLRLGRSYWPQCLTYGS